MSKVLVINLGSAYFQKIIERLDFLKVDYVCSNEKIQAEEIDEKIKGIILSGSPDNISEGAHFRVIDDRIYDLAIPILGICYGHQLSNHLLGGTINKAIQSEHGLYDLYRDCDSPLFLNMPTKQQVHMSHNDEVTILADGFEVIGHTDSCKFAACQNTKKNIYCLQFHPEVEDNTCGDLYFINFLKICKML